MSSYSPPFLDRLSSLIATAQEPVLIEACAGRTSMATKPCHAGPPLLMLSFVLGMAPLDAQAAETFRKLTESQIAGALAGMQFTDEVHWREVYELNGTLRTYEMGRNRAGNWRIENGRLCRAFPSENAGDCFDVWKDGNTLEMRRNAEDRNPIVGIVQTPVDPPRAAMKN